MFNELKVVVFALETTGFYLEKGDQVLSIGAVKMTDQFVDHDKTFYSLVKSDSAFSEISRLIGIHVTNSSKKRIYNLREVYEHLSQL